MSQFTLIDGDQRFVACNPSALKHYFHERHILDTENWEGKPNAFHLPRGRQPGIGWLLLLRSDLESINRASQSLSLEIKNGSSTFQINNLTITGARALTGSHEPTSNTIYLVELKDRRAFGEYTAFNAGYNLRDPSHDGGYTASSGAYYRNADWTWTTMLQDIASNIPFFAGLSLSNADLPSSPPENYQFRGVPALDALESLAETLSHYLIVHRNGSLHFVASDYSYPSNALLRGQGLKIGRAHV